MDTNQSSYTQPILPTSLFCYILRTFFNQMLATPLQLMHGLSKLLAGLSLIMSIINFVDSNVVGVSFAIFDFFCQKSNPQVAEMIEQGIYLEGIWKPCLYRSWTQCLYPSAVFTLKILNFVVKTVKILNFSRLPAPQANIFTRIQQFSNKKRLSLSKNPNILCAPSGSVIYLIALQIKNIPLGKPNLPPTRVKHLLLFLPPSETKLYV